MEKIGKSNGKCVRSSDGLHLWAGLESCEAPPSDVYKSIMPPPIVVCMGCGRNMCSSF